LISYTIISHVSHGIYPVEIFRFTSKYYGYELSHGVNRITNSLTSETTANKVRERSIKGNTVERKMTDTLFFFSCHCERFSVKQSANQGFPLVIQHLSVSSSQSDDGRDRDPALRDRTDCFVTCPHGASFLAMTIPFFYSQPTLIKKNPDVQPPNAGV